MSGVIEFVRFDSGNQANEEAEDALVADRKTVTMSEFQRNFADLPPSVIALLVFCNPSDEILHLVLEETRKKPDQIIDVLIHGNSNNNSTNYSMNICFVSDSPVIHKIKSTVAYFLDKECRNQCHLGKTVLGEALYQSRTEIVDQLHVNDTVKGCHILIIPLNATARDLHNAQQRLKNICYELYGNEYKFIIRTLFDYIPEENNDPDDQSCTSYLENRYKGDICQTIMELSLIRMHLVGDEPYISNRWSQKLVAMERDINQEHALKYVDRCSFIRKHPVANQFTQDLVPIFGRAWQIQSAFARTLDDVRGDIHFKDALIHTYGCLKNQEMTVNSKVYQKSLTNTGNSTSRFSSKIHSIQQAENGPEEKQVTGDIKSEIVS